MPFQPVIDGPHMQILHKRRFHELPVLQKAQGCIHIVPRHIQEILRFVKRPRKLPGR